MRNLTKQLETATSTAANKTTSSSTSKSPNGGGKKPNGEVGDEESNEEASNNGLPDEDGRIWYTKGLFDGSIHLIGYLYSQDAISGLSTSSHAYPHYPPSQLAIPNQHIDYNNSYTNSNNSAAGYHQNQHINHQQQHHLAGHVKNGKRKCEPTLMSFISQVNNLKMLVYEYMYFMNKIGRSYYYFTGYQVYLYFFCFDVLLFNL